MIPGGALAEGGRAIPMHCGRGMCVNCWQVRPLRPKRLCVRCYEARAVLEGTLVRLLFPPVSPRGRRYQDVQAEGTVPDEATQALPRSEAKVAALARRVQMRQALHRSDDSLIPD
jgi:hypothetical protein